MDTLVIKKNKKIGKKSKSWIKYKLKKVDAITKVSCAILSDMTNSLRHMHDPHTCNLGTKREGESNKRLLKANPSLMQTTEYLGVNIGHFQYWF